MRERDQALNQRLHSNISQLNSQIEETRRAEAARLRVLSELEAEAIQREKAQKELEEQSALLRSFLDSSPIWCSTVTNAKNSSVVIKHWKPCSGAAR